jgi:hypothetical protein
LPLRRHMLYDSDGGSSGSRSAADVEEVTELGHAVDQQPAASATSRPLIVSNIHVLFNPKRSDQKLGQVRLPLPHITQSRGRHVYRILLQIRTLMERVNSLCLQQWKLHGHQAACVLAGDFNSAAGALRFGPGMHPQRWDGTANKQMSGCREPHLRFHGKRGA